MLTTPVWLEHGQYRAEDDRRLIGALVNTEGVAGMSDLAPSAVAGTMQVSVPAGGAFIRGDYVGSRGSGMYYVHNDGATTVQLSPSSASLPRYDLVVLRVYDSDVTSSSPTSQADQAVFEVVRGTPATSPVVPTAPNSAIPIAEVIVSAGVTALQANNVVDRRPIATSSGTVAGGASSPQLTSLNSSATRGEPILATNSTNPNQLLISTGSGFSPVGGTNIANNVSLLPKSPPDGTIGYDTTLNRQYMYRNGRWKFTAGDGPYISVGAGKSTTGLSPISSPSVMVVNPKVGTHPNWEPSSSSDYSTYFGVNGGNAPSLSVKRPGMYDIEYYATVVNTDKSRKWFTTNLRATGSYGWSRQNFADRFMYLEAGDSASMITKTTLRVEETHDFNSNLMFWPEWHSNGRYRIVDYFIVARMTYEF